MDRDTHFDSLLPAATMDRRDFLVGLAATGFALAAGPVCAQTVIHTDSGGLDAGDAQLPVSGGSLPLYYAKPAGGRRLATVLVVQEIFGVHEYIRDVCRRLAKAGYFALAPELYFRQGDPAKLDNVGVILERIVARVPDAQVLGDLDAVLAWATRHGGDPERTGITGFCWGGRIVWLFADHQPRLKAAVAWYGQLEGERSALKPRQPVDVAASLSVPVLGLYGGQDQGISAEDVAAMRVALAKSGAKCEIVVYPDAPHAFHADYRPSYRQEAAEDGWRRLLAWFHEHGL